LHRTIFQRSCELPRYRPRYPQGVVELLRANCALTADSVIADVGSGTGMLSELFLVNGNTVLGVEPNAAMRHAAESLLATEARFQSVDGTAEHTTLPAGCADFVTAGQAFHWFDRSAAQREFRRILKPSGWVVPMWNERTAAASKFGDAYDQLLMECATEYEVVNQRSMSTNSRAEFFAGEFSSRTLANSQRFDFEGLKGRVMRVFAFIAFCLAAGTARAQVTVPPPAAQNPSPMVETSRAHARIPVQSLDGAHRSFMGPLDKPISVFLPARTRANAPVHLVIHFHGDSLIPDVAVQRLGGNHVAVTLALGSGSGVYDRSFSSPSVYDTLVASIQRVLDAEYKHPITIGDVTLVGFSAGHGAIRAILRNPSHFQQIHAVLLLDGMHTSYVPEGTVMAKGGTLDTANLVAFTHFARAAMRGEKRFIVTHSEIFPGTFASTTETADYLVQSLGLKRTPVLRWGVGGMQQLSSVKSGRFEIMGFAGNAGPDHIDQFHSMPELLRALLK